MKTEQNNNVKDYVNKLTVDQMSRWLCLIEGVNFIFDKVDKLGQKEESIFETKKAFNKLEHSLNVYIDERFEAMKADILINHDYLLKNFERQFLGEE